MNSATIDTHVDENGKERHGAYISKCKGEEGIKTGTNTQTPHSGVLPVQRPSENTISTEVATVGEFDQYPVSGTKLILYRDTPSHKVDRTPQSKN